MKEKQMFIINWGYFLPFLCLPKAEDINYNKNDA